ncbi:GTP 3',8-cyclase MoaA [Cytophagaceae bacterium ABcell3]|nr:GTP 3',8-cyclase MoaA [Cytophagaceae bacterium ABcell3]
MLKDQHHRNINYLRLSVTDKCNLRCFYCMPEEGIPFWKKSKVLSWEEMLRVCHLLTSNGVDKVRITGGEPFVRKDLMFFLSELATLPNAPEISLTTNATLITPYIDQLKSLGIKHINVSLDTLDKDRFLKITRRDDFETVYQNLNLLIAEGFNVKVNCVVMEGKNIEDLIPLAELSRSKNLSVRFLEEMPFNAQGGTPDLTWNYIKILNYLVNHFGEINKLKDPANATSLNYKVKGFTGSIGIIPSFSRTFCGSCNRMRLSANGDFRTCLYGSPAANLRDLLRSNISDQGLLKNIKQALANKPLDGYEADALSNEDIKDSMAYLGG